LIAKKQTHNVSLEGGMGQSQTLNLSIADFSICFWVTVKTPDLISSHDIFQKGWVLPTVMLKHVKKFLISAFVYSLLSSSGRMLIQNYYT
jgi:hypothetical protein